VPVPRQSSAYVTLFDADYSSIALLHNISDYSNPNYILSLLSRVKVVLVCDKRGIQAVAELKGEHLCREVAQLGLHLLTL